MLLFDQNISPKLVGRLADLYPNSIHVQSVGLERASDQEVWEFAKREGYVIVSKDADFSELSMYFGFPPKIVWIRLGNASTTEIETALRANHNRIVGLIEDEDAGVLLLV